jgi:hypothetical protein
MAVSVTERKGATYSTELDLTEYDVSTLEGETGSESPGPAGSEGKSVSVSEVSDCINLVLHLPRSWRKMYF